MVIASLCFLTAAGDVNVVVACTDPLVGGTGRRLIVPSPFNVRPEVDYISSLEIRRNIGFDAVASLIACSRSSEADWPGLSKPNIGIRTSFLQGDT